MSNSMTRDTISADNVLSTASFLFSCVEDNDMRRAIATFARHLILSELEWDGDFDTVADKMIYAAIEGQKL